MCFMPGNASIIAGSTASNASRSSSGMAMKAIPAECSATSASVMSHSPLSDRILPRLSNRDSRP